MDVHVRDLRYFVAVAEELSFTRAAERLFVSQPALSKQIAQLERQLRVPLLVRDRRSVTLTAAGEALLAHAQELLAGWDAAQHAVAEAAAQAAAVLVVGFSTSVGRGVLPSVTARFAQAQPGWRIQLRQVDWSDPTAGVADHSSDVAYVWLPIPDDPGFATRIVATEDRHVALPEAHSLARCTEIPFDALLDEPFLALPQRAGPLRDYWLAIPERQGHPVRIAAEVANADETFEAVANGAGIVLLSAGNAAIYQRPGIVTRPVRGLSPSQLVLIWRSDDGHPAVRTFVDAHQADQALPLRG